MKSFTQRRKERKVQGLAPAHKMDDFDPVAVAHRRIRPCGSAHDLFVVLDRYALSRQRKKIEQPVKRDLAFDPFLFTVQRYFH